MAALRIVLPKPMPQAAVRALARLPASDDPTSLNHLARELAERCADFCELDALYSSNEQARRFWSDSYYGIVETGHWLYYAPERDEVLEIPIRCWGMRVFPSVLSRSIQGLTKVRGLSPRFKQLEKELAAATEAAGRSAHHEDLVPILFTGLGLPVSELIADHKRDYFAAIAQFVATLDAIKDEAGKTSGDRVLKRRAIEIRFGPPGVWRIFSKRTMKLGTTSNLIDLRDLLKSARDRSTWSPPSRKDFKNWAWVKT
jgi:hypothetical protein